MSYHLKQYRLAMLMSASPPLSGRRKRSDLNLSAVSPGALFCSSPEESVFAWQVARFKKTAWGLYESSHSGAVGEALHRAGRLKGAWRLNRTGAKQETNWRCWLTFSDRTSGGCRKRCWLTFSDRTSGGGRKQCEAHCRAAQSSPAVHVQFW